MALLLKQEYSVQDVPKAGFMMYVKSVKVKRP